MTPKILIVEDEWLLAEYYRVIIEKLGYKVCEFAADAEAAVRIARRQDPDLILMDFWLKGEKDGVDAAGKILERQTIPTVYITAANDPATLRRIASDHAAEILLKPVLARQLEQLLAKHCPLP